MTETAKLKKGFATLSAARRNEIASMGGKAAHRSGRAHEFTSDEAREAGRKGGLSRALKRRKPPIVEQPADSQGAST